MSEEKRRGGKIHIVHARERGNSRKLRKREFVPPGRERTRGIAVRAIPLPTGGAMNALGCGFSWADPSARGGGSRRGRTFPTAAGARRDRWTSMIFSISSLPWAARRVTRGGGRRGARAGGEKKQRAHAARVARFPRRGSNIRRFRKRSVAAAPRAIRAPARSETRRGDAFGSRAGSTREETAGSAVASRRNARETRGGVTHVIVVLALVVRGRTAVSRGRHLASTSAAMFSAPCAEATRACPSERRERVRASTPPCARLALARAARRARTERAEADATRKSGVKSARDGRQRRSREVRETNEP